MLFEVKRTVGNFALQEEKFFLHLVNGGQLVTQVWREDTRMHFVKWRKNPNPFIMNDREDLGTPPNFWENVVKCSALNHGHVTKGICLAKIAVEEFHAAWDYFEDPSGRKGESQHTISEELWAALQELLIEPGETYSVSPPGTCDLDGFIVQKEEEEKEVSHVVILHVGSSIISAYVYLNLTKLPHCKITANVDAERTQVFSSLRAIVRDLQANVDIPGALGVIVTFSQEGHLAEKASSLGGMFAVIWNGDVRLFHTNKRKEAGILTSRIAGLIFDAYMAEVAALAHKILNETEHICECRGDCFSRRTRGSFQVLLPSAVFDPQ